MTTTELSTSQVSVFPSLTARLTASVSWAIIAYYTSVEQRNDKKSEGLAVHSDLSHLIVWRILSPCCMVTGRVEPEVRGTTFPMFPTYSLLLRDSEGTSSCRRDLLSQEKEISRLFGFYIAFGNNCTR